MPRTLGYVRELGTTNNYASALKLKLGASADRLTVHIKENNVAAVRWKVLSSLDDVVYETIRDEEIVLQNGSDYDTLTDLWRYVDVQVISNVVDVPGVVTIYVSVV